MQLQPYPWLVKNAMRHNIDVRLTSTDASRAVFVADNYCRVRSVRVVYNVAADSAGTLQVEVLTNGTAPGSGVNQLLSAINLSTTVNTPIKGSTVDPTTVISPGQSVGVVLGGTLTNLTGCVVSITIEYLQKGIV